MSLAASAARGEGAPDDDRDAGARTLKGHTFVNPSLPFGRDTAFVTTHFGFRQGVRLDNSGTFPTASVGDLSVAAANVTERLELAVALTDWLGLYGDLGGFMYVGIDAPSFYTRGMAFGGGGKAGAAVRVLRLEGIGTQVTLRAFVDGTAGKWAPVLRLGQALQSDPHATLDQLLGGSLLSYVVIPGSQVSVGGSAHAAQVITRAFSAQATLGVQAVHGAFQPENLVSGKRAGLSSDAPQVFAALALQADAASLGVPLAGLVEYSLESDVSLLPDSARTSTGPTHSVAVGVYYTGRRALQLGLSTAFSFNTHPVLIDTGEGTARSTTPGSSAGGELVFRFFW